MKTQITISAKGNKPKSKPSAAAYGVEQSKLMKLFEDELKDIYWAEKALTKAIPKMVKNATNETLVKALKSHLIETEGHVQKVEKVFAVIGKKAQAKKCEAMDGLIKEAKEIMESSDKGAMCDAGIISAGQKVEHYEIASYGTLKTFARILGHTKAVEILEKILGEEKGADQTLTEIAERIINIQAAAESE